MIRRLFWRLPVVAFMVWTMLSAWSTASPVRAQDATPTVHSCETGATRTSATPTSAMDHGHIEHVDMGTPVVAEIDQLYIDMMIPHHASIIALSQAALPRLQDERLRTMAQSVIDAQTAEITELGNYRQQWYGSAEPLPLDDQAMTQLMPGMAVPMDEMMAQMDAETQVAQFCAAGDPDLVFIDLTIPHHESAIMASETVHHQAAHPEIREFAQRVIAAQQREIEELTAIRQELYGAGTPVASSAAMDYGGPVVDQLSFVEALRSHGLTVEVAGPAEQPFLRPQSGTTLRLSGGSLSAPAEMQVFKYADPGVAGVHASQIGPDGNPRTAIIEWVAPRFFQTGRIIVPYVGSDPAVLDHLTQLFGRQFAGH